MTNKGQIVTSDPKQFYCNIFVRSGSEESAYWGFYQAKFGHGLGFSFTLIGSLFMGSNGMAVLDINDRIVEVVKQWDFSSAAKIFEVPDYLVLGRDIDEFQSWIIDQSDDYWSECDSASSAISSFTGDSVIKG